MSKFIEIEDGHFKKMFVNVDSIALVHENEISKTEIYLYGIEKPFISRKSYREVKSLIDSISKE